MEFIIFLGVKPIFRPVLFKHSWWDVCDDHGLLNSANIEVMLWFTEVVCQQHRRSQLKIP